MGQRESAPEGSRALPPFRYSPRIEPPCPITVAIEEKGGPVIAYGVVADISRKGGCVWTDVLLARGVTFHLRMSFAYPPELHTLAGTVTWARADPHARRKNAYCCGFLWSDLGYSLQCRLRQLTGAAGPRSEKERHLFERKWIVAGPWPPPPAVSPASRTARLDRLDPLATLPPGIRAPVPRPRALARERVVSPPSR